MGDTARLLANEAVAPGRAGAARRTRPAKGGLVELDVLPSPPGSAQPIGAALQRGLAGIVGGDLSAVRLHRDWFAVELTDALDARAVTHGDDIFLGRDAPDAMTPAGLGLLVHELVHSVHGGALYGPATVQAEEIDAERAGQAALRDVTGIALHRPTGGETEPTDGSDVDQHERFRQGPPPAGRWTRLGRRAKATLASRTRREPRPRPRRAEQTDTAATPDVVSAGEALVRLVDRLFSADPDDHGGRLTSVLGGLVPAVRDEVVSVVGERGGGHVEEAIRALVHERPLDDGGHTGPGTDAPGVAVDPTGPETDAPGVAVDPSAEAGASAPVVGDPSAEAGTSTPATGAEAASVGPGATGAVAAADVGAASVDPDATGAGATPDAARAPELDEQPPERAAVVVPPAEVATPAVGAEAPGGGVAAGPQTAPAPLLPGADAGPAGGGTAPALVAGDGASADGAAARDEQAGDEDAPAPADQSVLAEPATEAGEQGSPPPEAAARPATPDAGDVAEEPADPPEIADPKEHDDDDGQAEPSLLSPPAPTADATDDEGATPGEREAEDAEVGEIAEPSPADLAASEPSDADSTPEGGAAQAPATPPVESEPELADPPAPSGGGGGGGAAIAAPPNPAPPDVTAMEPQAALGAVSSLPATRLATNLTGVSAAATRTVADGTADLAAHPPSMPRPSGVPAGQDASLPAAPLPPLPNAPDRSVPPLAGGAGAAPPQPALLAPAGPAVTLSLPEPRAGGDTQITADDAARLQGAVDKLPTTDPALAVTAGPVPALELRGGEDPAQIDSQAHSVENVTAAAEGDGLTDARADMGENDTLPQVPAETLTAGVGAASGGGAGGAAGTSAAPGGVSAAVAGGSSSAGAGASTAVAAGPGAAGQASAAEGAAASKIPPEAIDVVAADQGGDKINAATQTQRAALGTARDEHEASAAQARADTDKQINDEIVANGVQQTNERREVRADVGGDRRAWVGEQHTIAGRSREAADTATKTADGSIDTATAKATSDAGKAVSDGNTGIATERSKAEQSAREQRDKAKQASDDGGFFSWFASKVTAFFNGIKNAIHAAFELARKAVDLAISAAQKLAVAAIELGRKAVVAAIEIGGKALAAAGDIVLAGFPAARNRFRAKIAARVAAAKKAVNELADTLKAGVTKLLDGLGSLLKGALSLMEKAYTMAIDAVAKVVDGVIKAAKAWVDALLDFAAIVVDIAASPVQWLRNLGASLVDGVKHHVWPALVKAVKSWFKSKVEAVVGVGSMILDVLRKGGIVFSKIVTMAWTAIKESLPGIMIQLLIEKLVALLIPAGGALALIIDGIKAAWGAAAKILAAFKKFIAFLKAVKDGDGGPSFGELVGAAAVAVMDFLANFVLSKLKGAGEKVGATLRKLADGFMKAVKKVAGIVRRGAKAAAGAVKRAVAATGRVIKRGAAAAVGAVKKVLPKNLTRLAGKAAAYVGKKVEQGVARAKDVYGKGKAKLGMDKPKTSKADKIKLAVARTEQAIDKLIKVGASPLRWTASLAWLRLRYRWKRLAMKFAPGGAGASIDGEINPVIHRDVKETVTVTSSTSASAVGEIKFFEVKEHLSVKVGEHGGVSAVQYEAETMKLLSQALIANVERLRDMVVLKYSTTSAGDSRRRERADSSGRPLSGDDVVIPHSQKALKGRMPDDGDRIHTTKPEVVAEVPTRNTTVALEMQLPHDYGDPRYAKDSARKVEQFERRLTNIGDRMQRGEFAEAAQGSAHPPRIVLIIVAPDFADEAHAVPLMRKMIQDFAAGSIGGGFFVEVHWVKLPIKVVA